MSGSSTGNQQEATQTSPGPSAASLAERIRTVGDELSRALAGVLGALPGAPHRPNQLARDLDVNRAVASKVLNATSKRDPLEVLHCVWALTCRRPE